MRLVMRMDSRVSGLFLAVILLAAATATQARHWGGDVEVAVIGDGGQTFATYPVERRSSADVYRAYLEARNQTSYRIRVHNRGSGRVGLVIAVDGRNIISGEKSQLARGESMYILDGWESATYEGWRTSRERVNGFYFTRWKDSYAEAFGDRSARGVIAVAVYRERAPDLQSLRKDAPAAAERSAQAPASPGVLGEVAENQPGTGFGEEIHSPVRVVAFEAQRAPALKYFIKYAWRDTLCRKGVIDCEPHERNRFWDEDEDRLGFAPYPPGK
ncbi:MAG TPA: hypothetical protein VIH25_00245 [Steroidobacteraceae bacterium]